MKDNKSVEERYEKLLLLIERLDLNIDEIVTELEGTNDILAGSSIEMLAIRLGKDELREKLKTAKEIVKQKRINNFINYVQAGRPESFFMFNELSMHDRLVFRHHIENLVIGVNVSSEEEKSFYLNTLDKFIPEDFLNEVRTFRIKAAINTKPLGGRH